MSEPIVMTRDRYRAKFGCGRSDFTDSALHVVQRRMSPKQVERLLAADRERCARIEVLQRRVDEEFDRRLASGEFRLPTRRERLEAIASGHPDHESVKAAKRLLSQMDDPSWPLNVTAEPAA